MQSIDYQDISRMDLGRSTKAFAAKVTGEAAGAGVHPGDENK